MFESAVIKGISGQRIVFFNKKYKKSHFFEAFVWWVFTKNVVFLKEKHVFPWPGAFKNIFRKKQCESSFAN